MYQIILYKIGKKDPFKVSFAKREDAMDMWDEYCDSALASVYSKMVLMHPKNSVLSEYTPARDIDRGAI